MSSNIKVEFEAQRRFKVRLKPCKTFKQFNRRAPFDWSTEKKHVQCSTFEDRFGEKLPPFGNSRSAIIRSEPNRADGGCGAP